MNEQIRNFMYSGQYDKAIDALNKLIAEDLEDFESVLSLSISFIENEQLKEGKKALDYLHSFKTPTDESLEALGVYWVKKNQYKKAILSFKAALNLNHSNGNVHRNIAMVYSMIYDLERAEHHLSQAIMLQPENYLTQLAVGQAYLKNGDFEKATYMLENILLSGIQLPPDKTEYIKSLIKQIYDMS